MIRKSIIYCLALLLVALVSCAKSEEALLQDTVTEAVTALCEGDVDTYLQHTDFGKEMDSLHVSLQEVMLKRFVSAVERKGGLESIGFTQCLLQTDSLASVSYSIRYKDGTDEQKIASMIRKNGRWRMKVL